MSCIVQDLPFDVLIHLWKDWINIHELAILDSAVCSVNIRPSLLSLLKHDCYIQHLDCELHFSTDFVIWLSTRRIKTDYLDLRPFFDSRIPVFVSSYISSSPITSLAMLYSANLLSLLNVIGNNLTTLSTDFDNFGAKKFLSLISTVPNITSLDIETESLLSCSDCQALVDHCPSLTSLNSIGYDSAESVKVVINGLNLTALDLPNVGLGAIRIGKDIMDLVTERLSNLTDLSLRNQRSVRDESMLKIADKCRKMKNLRIRACGVSDVSIVEIVNKCEQLTALDISDTDVTDATLLALSVRGNDCNLQTLSIRLTAITDKGICSFVTKCGAKLLKLWTNDCRSVTDVSLKCIALHCFKLRELHCSGCEFFDIDPLKTLLRAPMRSNCVMTKAQFNDLLASVIHGFDTISFTEHSSWSFLEPSKVEFNIMLFEDYSKNVCYVIIFSTVITSQLFRQIVLQCPNLSSVQLNDIQGVCDDDIVFLFEKCPLMNTLTLSGVDHAHRNFDGHTLMKCVGHCHSLYEFHMECANFASFDSVIEFFTAIGKQLKYLSFIDCIGLTNDSLITIASLCPNLRRFYSQLSYNVTITPMTNKAILESCPLLENLQGKERGKYRFLRQGAI